MIDNYIKKEELVIRGVYELRARNLTIGVWTGEVWIGVREKFGDRFLDECEVPYSTAFPISFIEMLPEDIELKSRGESVCSTCQKPVSFESARDEHWQHLDNTHEHRVYPVAPTYKPMFYYLNNLER